MPGIIHVLSDAVANQIAAGEVIQRPSSVVKELMENAVDAQATSVKVIIKDAGKTLIQVVDNGAGMSESDAVTCFERHSTSKISSANDLFTIRTRGFRGEALASMAAISEVTLRTCLRGEELGTAVRIAGSKLESTEIVACQQGSNFQIRNLFFNIPARRKFLKRDHTELRHIINEFNHVALTHPEIECTLVHNDTEILQLPPCNLRQRITGVFGKSVNSNLIPLETETSLVRIHGFIGKPEHAKRTYGEQFFFVNQRFIKHPYFHKAVMKGYDEILAPDHLPSYFIYFETDPSKIDVNIHPSKTEVKFEEERSIWQILLASVKEAIGRHNLSPSLDFNKEGVIDIPVLSKNTEIHIPEIETNPGYNPFEAEESSRRNSYSGGSTFEQQERYRVSQRNWEQLFEPVPESGRTSGRVMQIKNKYILSPVKSGLMVIDQYGAHERINYERLIEAARKNKPVAQQTLFPETVHLSAADYQVCLEMLEDLGQLGFEVRDLGNQTVVIHGLPASMTNSDPREKLETLLAEYQDLLGQVKDSSMESLIRAAARASAVGSGCTLGELEMQGLVDQLFACKTPNHTPSGKTIVKIVTLEEMDNLFKQ